MSFQGKDFTPAMKQLVMNLKLHFDEERKHSQEVSTRNPTLRTAQGLDIGESTVKRIMAEYRHHGYPDVRTGGINICRGDFLILRPSLQHNHRTPVETSDVFTDPSVTLCSKPARS